MIRKSFTVLVVTFTVVVGLLLAPTASARFWPPPEEGTESAVGPAKKPAGKPKLPKSLPYNAVLKPGDVVRIGDSNEAGFVVAFRPGIIGIFFMPITAEGKPVPGSHVNLMLSYKNVINPGTARWTYLERRESEGFEFTHLLSAEGAEGAETRVWPGWFDEPKFSRAQLEGRVTGVAAHEGWPFLVQGSPIFCFWVTDPSPNVNCQATDQASNPYNPYVLAFGEPWGSADYAIAWVNHPSCGCSHKLAP